MAAPRLTIVPASLANANAFVARYHRHHDPVTGHKFSLAVCDAEARVRGVAIVGRPVSREIQAAEPGCLEVLRDCTDGYRNACSCLYAAAWRAVRALGYTRLISYTLPEEGGASLRAAGWRMVAEVDGGRWNCQSRPRLDTAPTGRKWRWEVSCESGPVPVWPEAQREGVQLALEAAHA